VEVEEIINKSGYPLQLAIEKLINNTTKQHGWRVVAKEHRWSDNYGNEGYIDLILDHKRFKTRAVVECKKILGSWNFLIPEVNPQPFDESIILKAFYAQQSLEWVSLPIMHETLESAFCVPEVVGQQDRRTLEQIAGELLLAVEAQAHEEINIYPYDQPEDKVLFYIPIIVAATILRKVLFDPNEVAIDDGTLRTSIIETVSYIRFRKSLSSTVRAESSPSTTVMKISKSNERVVYIVQTASLVDFLSTLTNSIDSF
jgi:hypothetical protein